MSVINNIDTDAERPFVSLAVKIRRNTYIAFSAIVLLAAVFLWTAIVVGNAQKKITNLQHLHDNTLAFDQLVRKTTNKYLHILFNDRHDLISEALTHNEDILIRYESLKNTQEYDELKSISHRVTENEPVIFALRNSFYRLTAAKRKNKNHKAVQIYQDSIQYHQKHIDRLVDDTIYAIVHAINSKLLEIKLLKKRMLALIGIVVLLSLLLFFISSRQTTVAIIEPLRNLTIAVQKFELGEETFELEQLNSSNDEIKVLQHSFQDMQHRIILAQEQKEAREVAEKANKAKSEFIANMSHELRTPLHGILSFADFGFNKIGNVPEQRIKGYFSQILASGNRLKVLLNDLLDFSKLEAGKMEMVISQVALQNIINECADEQQALLKSNKLVVDIEFAVELPVIDCDRNRIGQVIMNLLSNAIKFSPYGGKISIHGQVVKMKHNDMGTVEAVQISVADQGSGVPEDELDVIFDKFVQSSKNKNSAGGTGLGLSICKEIIKAHGGTISAMNNSEGGTIFTFVIPCQFFTTEKE